MDIVEIASKLNVDIEEIIRLKKFNTELDIGSLDETAKALDIERGMINSLVSTFDSNIAYFKEHRPQLYARFASFTPENSFEFFSSGNGIPNILFAGSNKALYPDRDPVALCDRQVDELSSSLTYREQNYKTQSDRFSQINHRYVNESCLVLEELPDNCITDKIADIGAMPHLTLLGAGLGYIIGSLVQKFAVETMVVIEPNCDLFYASLYTFNYAAFLDDCEHKNRQVDFIVGQDLKYIQNFLQDYYEAFGSFLAEANCIVAHYINDSMKELLEFYSQQYYRYYTMLGFCDDSLYGICNTIRSVTDRRSLVRADVKMPDSFENVPVFVIGNGPSLDNDIAFLRANQDRALIVACGSALDSLYNAGIKADIYVASERTFHIGQTLEIFEGTSYLDDIFIATACTTHKNTISHFKNTLIFDKYDESIVPALKDNPNFKGIENWQDLSGMNPLVGNAGLSVAIHLGFKNIYLFGIDNGRPELCKNLHSAFSDIYGSKYKAREVSDISGSSLILDGNFGGHVASNALYRISKDFLESLLETSHVNCFNCSDGALVKGAEPKRSSEIELCDLNADTKDALKQFLRHEKVMHFNADNELISNILDKEKFAAFIDKLVYIIKSSDESRSSVLYNMRVITNILHGAVHGSDLFIKRIIAASSQYFFMYATRALYTIADERTALDTAARIFEKYIYLLEDIKYIYQNFMPFYFENDHIKLMEGKIGRDHDRSKAPPIASQFKVIDTKKDGVKKNAFVKRYE